VRSGITIGVQIVAALLSLSIVIGTGVAWAFYRNLQSNVRTVQVFGQGDSTQSPPVKDIDGSAQNILIIGDDSRDGATPEELQELNTEDDGGSNNTDTIMVLHVPADGSQATIISFPRDSYVDIPGFGMNKINAAFADGQQASGTVAGGVELLAQVIENLTGLTMDHFVEVGLLAFLRISNAIGGVEVNLCAPVQDSFSGIDLPAGPQTIEGSQAVAFVRQRHGLPGGDLDRVIRQQVFLTSAFKKIVSAGILLNPLKLNDLINAVSSSLVVDSGLNILTFAQQMSNLTSGNLRTATIPVLGTPTITVGGAPLSIVELNTAAIPAFISELIGAPDTYTQAKPVQPSTVQVDVVDATSAGDAGGPAIAALAAAGFQATTATSDDEPVTTVISYPPGMDAQAKTLAQYVPGAQIFRTTSVQQVTLTLADDGILPQSTPGPTGTPTPTAAASPTPQPSASGGDSGTGGANALGTTPATDAAGSSAATPTPSPSVSGVRTGDDATCIN
jgi:LCP family protein required for cell wall assembly